MLMNADNNGFTPQSKRLYKMKIFASNSKDIIAAFHQTGMPINAHDSQGRIKLSRYAFFLPGTNNTAANSVSLIGSINRSSTPMA